MLHVGTTLHPGENINFSLDDKGEMYINAKGGGMGDLPWCSGYFKDRSVPTGAFFELTPIITLGNQEMLEGSNLVISESGVYLISTGVPTFNINAQNHFGILRSFLDETQKYVYTTTNWSCSNPFHYTEFFEKGEHFSFVMNTTTAVSTIARSGNASFRVMRIV